MAQLDLSQNVQVVDDSDFARRNMVMELRKIGFRHFLESSDVKQALEMLAARQVGLIICDYQMPGMSGTDFLHKLRRSSEYDHIPFILVTAHAAPQVVAEIAEYGGDSIMVKPYSLQTLEAKINQAFRTRGFALNQAGGPARTVSQLRATVAQGAGNVVTAKIKLEKDSPKLLIAQGIQRESTGDRAGARAKYLAALEAEPQFIKAHDLLANLCLKEKDLPKALEHLRRAVELNPGNAQRRHGLAQLLLKNGDQAGAAALWKGLAQDPEVKYPELLGRVADALEALGLMAEARAALNKALAIQRRDISLYLRLARLHLDQGDTEAGLEILGAGVRAEPDNPQARWALTQALVQAGQDQRAREEVDKVLGLDPNHAEALAFKQRMTLN